MFKAIVSVVVGYLVMAVVVFTTIFVTYAAVGPEGAFKPGSYDVTTSWLLTSVAFGVVGALAGGFVCAWIASRGSRAPHVLAGLTLVLGLLMAVPAMMGSMPSAAEVRTPEVTTLCAMQRARTPLVAALLYPIVGMAGVLAGARLRAPRGGTPG
jgi:hypothetical protein